jgi:neutral ceramidase
VILKQLGALADRVVGDVFESFSKHPKDKQKREAEEKARLAVPHPPNRISSPT